MMSENVIERLISRLRDYVLDEAADWLEAATRPEQFMPPLRDWPEDAEWCSIDSVGDVVFDYSEPFVDGPFWYEEDHESRVMGSSISIPLGIDWRTLKVSREQMAKWEAENG